MNKYLPAVLCCLMLLAVSCAPKVSPEYEQLIASDFGLGIHFEDTPEAVHAVLGPPTASQDVQPQVNVEEYWFSPSLTTIDVDTPQLSLNFHQGALMRVHNAYDALNPDLPEPPFVIEPLPGVKLGLRRSSFVDALGEPTDSTITDTWTFDGPDGRQIVLRAEFSDAANAGDAICTRLQVVLVNALPPQRGEEFERQS